MNRSTIKTCEILLREYQDKPKGVNNPVKLSFTGVGGKDVYNITAPFTLGGERDRKSVV